MMHTVIDASERFRGKSRGGLYGGVVEEFDYETGRLLDTLDELGLRKDTLVIYTTDNGPWNQPAYYESKMGLRPDLDLKFRSKNKKGRLNFSGERNHLLGRIRSIAQRQGVLLRGRIEGALYCPLAG